MRSLTGPAYVSILVVPCFGNRAAALYGDDCERIFYTQGIAWVCISQGRFTVKINGRLVA
jgi:hypothetical protein